MKRSTWFVLDVFLLLIFWSAITAYVPGAADVLPPVTKIASKMAEFLFSGALVRDIIVSLGRTLAGFAIAICTALPMGIALGTSPRLARAIDPLIEVLRPISPIAWIPLSILWLGIGESSKIFIIWQIAFFFILLNTVAGIKGIDKYVVEAAQTLGADRIFLVVHVLLPASLPQILVGLRLGLSVSIGGVILAEMVAAQSGLGVLIERSRVTLSPEPMVVGILTIGIIGYLANRAMLLIEGRLTKYRAATLQQVD